MTASGPLALPPRPRDDDDGHGGHDTPQRPETDLWPGWTGVRIGPNHLEHAGHPRRD